MAHLDDGEDEEEGVGGLGELVVQEEKKKIQERVLVRVQPVPEEALFRLVRCGRGNVKRPHCLLVDFISQT